MSTTAQYASTVKAATISLTATANTARDGTGTITTVHAAGASGTRIDDIYIVATAATTAGVIRLFISPDGGTTNKLWQEILVTATTPSVTQAVWSYTLLNQGLTIPTGYALRASTHIAEAFNVMVTRAGDF
jgi:hypothetical protein